MEPRYYLQTRQDGAFFLPVRLSRIIFALLTFPSLHARFFPLHYSRLAVSKAGFPVDDFPRSPLVCAASARATCVSSPSRMLLLWTSALFILAGFSSLAHKLPYYRGQASDSLFCKLHNSKRAAILMQSRLSARSPAMNM